MTAPAIPGYSSRDWPEVTAFLSAHPGLCQAVVELPTAVARYFAPDGRMTLEVQTDPEDGAQSLAATIITTLSPAAARARLDQFDRRWWHSRALRYCQMVVTVQSA